MQRFLKQNTTVKTVLCEKTDRLYRNFYDSVAMDIDQSDLTVILVKENTVLHRESRSHGGHCSDGDGFYGGGGDVPSMRIAELYGQLAQLAGNAAAFDQVH